MSGSLVSTDVLVIGGGLAGERCAIEAAAAHSSFIFSCASSLGQPNQPLSGLPEKAIDIGSITSAHSSPSESRIRR